MSDDSFLDQRDGKKYKTVRIGSQIWFAENLAFCINVYDANYKCFVYANVMENLDKYGFLYNWEAAKKACPAGWHLPTDAEWQTLINFIISEIGSDNISAKLKASEGWKNDGNGTDDFGFAALPSGFGTNDLMFYDLEDFGTWWSATEDVDLVFTRGIRSTYENVLRNSNDKKGLFSVRCVKDVENQV